MNARWIRFGNLEQPEFDVACSRLALAQRKNSDPVLAWGRAERQYLFALITPLKRAPGRATRWLPWGLTAAIATYRQFGYAAYLDGGEVWLYGRKISEASVRTLGQCVVIASAFLLRFPEAFAVTPSRELEDAFRQRLEAQHGWQFDHSWPTASERVDYALA